MKLLERSSKEESPKKDRRKDRAARLRRQREIEEERQRRLQIIRIGPGLFGF